MRTLALSALALLLAAPTLAQEAVVLHPGHSDLMTADLEIATETINYRVAEPRVRDLGSVTTAVERDGDRVVLTTEADAPQARQVYESAVTVHFPTLAPVRREWSTDGSRGTTDYDGAHVTGEFARGEWAPLPYDITLPGATFAPETLPLIARALPFTEGYTATVPTFTAETRVRDYTLTVTGMQEYTRADGSTVSTWAIEQTVTATRAPAPRTYYVDAGTRELVASTTTGAGDAVIISEPVTEASLAAAAAATPAIELRPGLGRLETGALASYSQDFVIKVVQPIQQDAGTMSRTLTVDEAAGTVTLVATSEIAMAGQETSETLVAAYPTLAPISNETDANGTVIALTYDGNAVTGTRTPADGEAEAINLTLDDTVYDGSWLFEVVRLVPFEEGYRGTFHTVSPTNGATEVTLTVIEQEEIDGRTAWLIEAQPAEGGPTEFAVDAETRDLLRIRLLPQPGVIVDIVPAAEG